jgi:transposase-like protein
MRHGCRGYRFPSDIIQRAVWMYLRFTLSYRDVEDLLAERSIQVTYETVRRWVLTFGPVIARRLRMRRPLPHRRWHLDEMFVQIDGKPMYLWRAVDAEGEVLDMLVQPKRDKRAAQKLMRKLLKKQGCRLEVDSGGEDHFVPDRRTCRRDCAEFPPRSDGKTRSRLR